MKIVWRYWLEVLTTASPYLLAGTPCASVEKTGTSIRVNTNVILKPCIILGHYIRMNCNVLMTKHIFAEDINI